MNKEKSNLIVGGIALLGILLFVSFAVFVSDQEGITVVEKINDASDMVAESILKDIPKGFKNREANYSVFQPPGWYPHSLGDSATIFTRNEVINSPQDLDFTSSFIIVSGKVADYGASNPEEWLIANGMTEDDPLGILESLEEVEINGYAMTRIVQNVSDKRGSIVHYIYFVDDENFISLSHYPYDSESRDSKDFEGLVNGFRLND